MKRRNVLRAAGVGSTIGLAGCSSVPFLGGGGCGPGEEKIGTLADQAQNQSTESQSTKTDDGFSKIVGKIQSIQENEAGITKAVIIDDGTGTAKLTTLGGGGFRRKNVGKGDCVEATGVALPSESGNVDVEFVIKSVGVK